MKGLTNFLNESSKAIDWKRYDEEGEVTINDTKSLKLNDIKDMWNTFKRKGDLTVVYHDRLNEEHVVEFGAQNDGKMSIQLTMENGDFEEADPIYNNFYSFAGFWEGILKIEF